MAVVLPYRFDTSSVVRLILRGVVALLGLVILPGLLYVVLARRDPANALLLVLTGAAVVYFGILCHKHLEGSRGVVTADAVEVEPTILYGVRLTGPVGRFPIDQFQTVRVERASAPVDVPGHGSERVRFVGRPGTPDILIARAEPGAGKVLGKELAAAVGIPYEEVIAGY